MAGDVAECVISLELANDQFDTSTVVVEAPEVERLQRQIGDQDLVVVAAELEQCQLLARLFGLWAANDHEATAAPPAGRLVAELGDLDAAARTGVAQVGEPALDGPGQARDDDKAGLPSFEPFDQAVIVKPLVGADYNRPHTGRNLSEAGRKKVEDDARGWLEKQGHPVQEAVMQSAQLRKRNRGNTQQEAPQRRSVGITWQSSEVLKDAVLAEQLGRVDTVEPEQHGIEQRQKHLPNTVAIVTLRQPDLSRNGILESNSGKESMQQVHPAIMGETRCTEFYGELPRPTWHNSQSYLLGSFGSGYQKHRPDLRRSPPGEPFQSRITPDSG